MSPEIKPQITIRQDAQGKKMLEIPGHGEIEFKERYSSSDITQLYPLPRYLAGKMISEVKRNNPDIVGAKISQKPQQLDYDLNSFVLLIPHCDEWYKKWLEKSSRILKIKNSLVYSTSSPEQIPLTNITHS